jgi:[ribosomal protein S5]-alanine N-acetyltransferase
MTREDDVHPAPLETQRLLVEWLRLEHAAKLYPVLRDPRIYRFIPDEPPSSEMDLEALFARYLQGPPPSQRALFFNWAVRLKGEGSYIGTLQATVDLESRRAILAYLVGPDFWGKGLASEALRALLAYLFSRGDIDSAEARIDSRNEASVRLVRRVGFQLRHMHVKVEYFKGFWSDEYLFGIHAPARA